MTAEILGVLSSYLNPLGFEVHPFLVSWYNELVDAPFRLPYSDDTLAVVIVSGPSSFERAFLPFCRRQRRVLLPGGLPKRDLFDTFMRAVFTDINELFPAELQPDLIHDFDADPLTRRPRVVLQTAAHVSGAAYHYDFRRELRAHREDIDSLLRGRRLLGVCLHPRFGGWFGLRGVAVFPVIDDPDLPRPLHRDLLATDKDKLWLCEEFNLRSADNRYRDAIKPVERYSEKQELFWKTLPANRSALVEQWLIAEEEHQEIGDVSNFAPDLPLANKALCGEAEMPASPRI